MKEYFKYYLTWFKIGLFTFGGGYAMLPMIEKEVIENNHWANEEEIMNYYAIGQCTPGIIAVNVATFVGYFQKGLLGAILCTLGVVSPSVLIISAIAGVLNNFSELAIFQNALSGIRIAVCVLMTTSLIKMYKKGVVDIYTFIIFILIFSLAQFTNISTVILVILSGTLGILIRALLLRKRGAVK